ncbi:hypothetical protein RD792_001976 [Penstemon davidsonii]|uniref:Peptidase S54 rhomboid domain-containing protein n=1 Tax=Penstemon davidsonii TaxID=160366 RepID=A0ABR0DQ48_9LAMI|nr:hypothetical protein RD792_001976 [Penstemon davidsonii]
MSSNPKSSSPLGPTYTNHLFTTAAAALRLRDALHRRLNLAFFLRSSLKKSISHIGDGPLLMNMCHERALQFTGFNCFQWSFNALSATLMSLSFFNGDESRREHNDIGKSQSKPSRRDLFDKRQWTNILLAANVLVYMAQTVSDGKILFWGAKVNCYSLNSVGPSVENICGPKRYLSIYIASAIASSGMSYWFSKAPAVGASGAIFGLVGSFAVFVLRHRGIVKGTEGNLKHIAQVILLNMTIGLLSQGIDNWGHVGGLIGGAAISWLLGPAWEVQSISGRKVLIDKAPILSLVKRHPY